MSFDRQAYPLQSLPFNMVTHGLHFCAVSFFCYVALLLLLAPLWGWHLYGMADWVLARAHYLEQNGGQPHSALSVFRDLSAAQVFKSGALLGFLFLAWPWAIWLGLLESILKAVRSKKLRWFGRCVGVIVAWLVIGDLILSFAVSTSFLAWAILVSLFLPLIASECINRIKNRGLDAVQRKLWLIAPMMLLLFLSAAIHPVWDCWLRPQRFEGLVIGTVIRDMLLLNRDGEHWFNNWYYDHSPLLMERERLTQFQPMTVATFGVDRKWHRFLKSGLGGQRVFFFEHKGSIQQAIADAKSRYLDHLVFARSFWENLELKVNDFPAGAVTVLSHSPWPENNEVWQVHLKKEFYSSAGGQRSPLVRGSIDMRNHGYSMSQSDAVDKGKRGLLFLLSDPISMMTLSMAFIGGGLYLLFILIANLCRRPVGCCFVVASVVYFFVCNDFINKLSYWQGDSSCDHEQIRRLHHMAIRSSVKDVIDVIEKPFPEDMRQLMLTVSVLGRGMHLLSDANQIFRMDQKVEELLSSYQGYPLNLRYKIIDAFAVHPMWRRRLEVSCRGEGHPYVTWYMSRYGLGL